MEAVFLLSTLSGLALRVVAVCNIMRNPSVNKGLVNNVHMQVVELHQSTAVDDRFF